MRTTKHTIEGKQIELELQHSYNFGAGFRKYVENGLNLGYTYGKFRSKYDRSIVGEWRLIEKEDKGSYFIKLWKKLNWR